MLDFLPMTDPNQEVPGVQDQALEIDNLPNRLSIFRIILVPLVIGLVLSSQGDHPWIARYRDVFSWTAALLFGVAALTDYFDGYFARKKNIITLFGSFLDPIADKFLVISCLITLEATHKIPVLVVIILVLREFYITALRLLGMNEGIQIPVVSMGKWKTATQMVGIPLLMLPPKALGVPWDIIGSVLIYIASFLSLYSATQYSINMVKKIKIARSEKKKGREPEL